MRIQLPLLLITPLFLLAMGCAMTPKKVGLPTGPKPLVQAEMVSHTDQGDEHFNCIIDENIGRIECKQTLTPVVPRCL